MLIVEQQPAQYGAMNTTPLKAPRASPKSKANKTKKMVTPVILAQPTPTAHKIDVADFLSMFAKATPSGTHCCGSQSDGEMASANVQSTPKSARSTTQRKASMTGPKKVSSMPNTSSALHQRQLQVHRAASFTDAQTMVAAGKQRAATTVAGHSATPTRMQAFATPAYAHSPSAKDVPPPPMTWTCAPITDKITMPHQARQASSHSLHAAQSQLMTKPLTGMEFINVMKATK